MSIAASALADDQTYAERWRLWEIAYSESSRKTSRRVTVALAIVFAAIGGFVLLSTIPVR